MGNIKQFLREFFEKKSIKKLTDNENYFTAGVIDSFEVILFISEIESKFNIKFNNKHFQDRRFSTINGLAILINELYINRNSCD